MRKLKLNKNDKLHIKHMLKTAKWLWPNEFANIKVSDFTNKMLNDEMTKFAKVASNYNSSQSN